MRLVVGLLTCIALGGAGLAWADPPASAATPTPAPAQTSAPAAATPVANATSTPAAGTNPPVVVEGTKEADPLEKHFLAEGYKIEMHNGEKYFCRREETLGTRLGGQKVCGTAQQLQATEQEAHAAYLRGQSQQTNPKGN